MTKEQRRNINDLLDKYLAGKCTPEEERVVDDWFDTLEVSDTNYLEQNPVFAAAAANKLRTNLGITPVQVQERRSTVRWLYRACAAAIVTGIVVAGIFYQRNGEAKRQTAPAVTALQTGRKELKKLLLPDGSVVWLNEFSKLEWTSRFNNGERIVKLTGEACFAVTSNADMPFKVQVGNSLTTVLGTTFNMEAYDNEQSVRVSLLSGKVQFENADHSRPAVILLPGKMVTYSRSAGNIQVSNIANEAVDEWIKGAIVFNELPVKEAIERLAKHYAWKVSWKIAVPGNERVVTAVFRKETPEQMLQGITFSNGLHYLLKDNQLTIH